MKLQTTQLVFTCSKSTIKKHQNNAWNLVKVNNQCTRTTSVTLFRYLYVLTLNRFHFLFFYVHHWLQRSKCLLGINCHFYSDVLWVPVWIPVWIHEAICSQCTLPVPPENIRNPYGFDIGVQPTSIVHKSIKLLLYHNRILFKENFNQTLKWFRKSSTSIYAHFKTVFILLSYSSPKIILVVCQLPCSIVSIMS